MQGDGESVVHAAKLGLLAGLVSTSTIMRADGMYCGATVLILTFVLQMMAADVDMPAAPCLSVAFGDGYRGLIVYEEGRRMRNLLVQLSEDAP